MDKNKIISVIFWSSLFLAVIFGVYRFFIARDFLVTFQTDCDPTIENCFVGRCDESFGECTGDEEEDEWYYSKVKKMAYNVSQCNPNEEECPDESICDQPVTQRCWVEKCDENTIGEEEECITPEEYLAAHPEALEEEIDESEEAEAEEPDETEETEVPVSEEEGTEEGAGAETAAPTDANLMPTVPVVETTNPGAPLIPTTSPIETVVPY